LVCNLLLIAVSWRRSENLTSDHTDGMERERRWTTESFEWRVELWSGVRKGKGIFNNGSPGKDGRGRENLRFDGVI
jgi:hypothetical protein